MKAPRSLRTFRYSSRAARLLLAVYFSLAPSSVPLHRLGLERPPAAMLVVGDPVTPLRR